MMLGCITAAMVAALSLSACSQATAPVEKAKPVAEQPKSSGAAEKAVEQAKPAAPATKAVEQQKPAASSAKPTEQAKPKELVVVRAGLQGQSSDSAAFIADARGYFKEQGVQFQHVPIGAPADMVPALATGQVDVAGTLGNPTFFNALARGVKMKGVADKGSLPKGNGFIALLVRKDLVDKGRYKTLSDLKGMKIALTPPANASSNLWDLEMTLKKAGLTEKDVELIGLPLADMPAALAGGSIDAGVTTEPYVSKAVEMGAAVRVIGMGEVIPDYQLTGISFSEEFMKSKPDAARGFVAAYIKGARDYNDAFMKNKNKAEVIKILTQATVVKDTAIWEKIVPPGLNPNGYLNVDNIMEKVDWMIEKGQIKDKPKPEDFIDHQYVDYAIKLLGKYE